MIFMWHMKGGWVEDGQKHSRIRIRTENGEFTIVEHTRDGEVQTSISVDGQLVVLPRSTNAIHISETL